MVRRKPLREDLTNQQRLELANRGVCPSCGIGKIFPTGKVAWDRFQTIKIVTDYGEFVKFGGTAVGLIAGITTATLGQSILEPGANTSLIIVVLAAAFFTGLSAGSVLGDGIASIAFHNLVLTVLIDSKMGWNSTINHLNEKLEKVKLTDAVHLVVKKLLTRRLDWYLE
jgi:hypothetical protein